MSRESSVTATLVLFTKESISSITEWSLWRPTTRLKWKTRLEVLPLHYPGIELVKNEIRNLHHLKPYHISPLIEVFETIDAVVLVQHKADAGDMMNFLKKQSHCYGEELIKGIIFKILEKVAVLHMIGTATWQLRLHPQGSQACQHPLSSWRCWLPAISVRSWTDCQERATTKQEYQPLQLRHSWIRCSRSPRVQWNRKGVWSVLRCIQCRLHLLLPAHRQWSLRGEEQKGSIPQEPKLQRSGGEAESSGTSFSRGTWFNAAALVPWPSEANISWGGLQPPVLSRCNPPWPQRSYLRGYSQPE